MSETGTPLIEIENMTKVFYTDEVETHALSGVHLMIRKGEYVAMSGPSGCGKSTLLSIIGLLDTCTAGNYKLNGQPVENLDFSDRSRIRNREIGFIFQSFNLIGDLTVYENVELPLTYRDGMPSAERKRRVLESLERVGMAHRLRHYPSCWLTSQLETWIRAMAKLSWSCCSDCIARARPFAWSPTIRASPRTRSVKSISSTARLWPRKSCAG
jgi:predicted ABC-type transport system involved in lysophospholipase L1 biosynthesis ATPase subunit